MKVKIKGIKIVGWWMEEISIFFTQYFLARKQLMLKNH